MAKERPRSRFNARLLLLLYLVLLSSTVRAAVIRVVPTGDDAHDGLTWGTAKRTVTAGLAAAAAGDQVWVMAGVYTGCVTLKSGVALYGGFAGIEENLADRNWCMNVTILDGNASGSVISTAAEAAAGTRIDGFTIRGGSGTLSTGNTYGGGIYCVNVSPEIFNNTIAGNTAKYGGGIYCLNCSPVITNNLIKANAAGAQGGGITCDTSSPPITNNTIIGNSAPSGGAVYCSAASPAISNNIVAFNSSGIHGSDATPVLRHNCVHNPGGSDYSSLTPGDGDMLVDPQLLGADYGELHLAAGSPCIDSGENSVVQTGWLDLDGEPRIQNEQVDIGADEYNGTPPAFTLKIIRVSPSGDNAHDGSAWEQAKLTVQAGIDAAAAAGGGEVWVAAGTYTQRITLKPWVHVYGGFAGTETLLDERDWAANVTILDGDAGGSVVSVTSCARTGGVNGFTIRNGTGTLSGGNHYGGGIYCSHSSPAIANNTVTANAAKYGAGIYCSCSSPAVSNNMISANTASSNGGGILCESSSAPAITASTIAGNTAATGGGICCNSSSPTISVVTISGNIAGSGGGIYCGSSSAPTISGNSIISNTATIGSGHGGGIACESSSAAIVSNNRILGNVATYGGGVYCLDSDPAIFNNRITGNGARYGGGVSLVNSSSALSNNTLLGNIASYGGGLYCNASSATISNNVAAFNSSGIYKAGGTPTLHNNCVYNPDGYNYSTGLTAGTGDITVDPQLLSVEYGGIHLAEGSPCIDAGDDAIVQTGWLDLDGEPRVQDAHVDIGADEYNGTPPTFTPTVVRVSPSGSDAHDGASWEAPKLTVQAAIDAAAETGGEVWVAAGTYHEHITLNSWVYVYGGFAGTENTRDERNWAGHVAVLDASAAGSVVSALAGHRASAIDGFEIRNGTGTSVGGYNCGGGVYCSYSSPAIANNTITANSAARGGGVYCSYCLSQISNNVITANTATSAGGGLHCTSASPTISYNIISGNSVTGSSGAGGGIYCSASAPVISNNTIMRNTAGSGAGGGIYCASASAVVSNNRIVGNVAVNGGGAYCTVAAKFVNDALAGNRAIANGGGMYNYSSSPTLANCTFTANQASAGAALCNNNGSNPNLANCILWANSGSVISNPSGMPTLAHCDIQGGWTGTGNINADPKFARSPVIGGDNTWGTADDDYGDLGVQAASPCIDAGGNADLPAGTLTDLDGRLRLLNDPLTADCSFAPGTCGTAPIVDMGAYEYVPAVPGDYDRDGDVAADDLAAFTACFSGPAVAYAGDCTDRDFDHDSDVDQEDLGVFQRCFSGAGRPANSNCAQ